MASPRTPLSTRRRHSDAALLAAPLCALVACLDPADRPLSTSRDPFGLTPTPPPAPHATHAPGSLGPLLGPLTSTTSTTGAPTRHPPVSSPGPQISPPPDEPDPGDPDDAPHSDPPHADQRPDQNAACPPEMVLIHGDHCVDARQDCAQWLDQESPGAPKKRCARFEPSRCAGARKHMRFCIDRLEYAPSPRDLPLTDLSWTTARATCESLGKRLCTETEWTFACEGPDMLPYPHGLERGKGVCNFDRDDLVAKGKMLDHRRPVDAFPACVSPFGVRNMVGNADEWVWLEKGYHPMRSGLKGGWWLAGRNRCRPVTGGHDEFFHEIQAGFRCCKAADGAG